MALHNLPETNTFTDPIPVPTDGDTVTADAAGAGDSPVNVAFQGLTNRTRHLYEFAGTHQPPAWLACDDGAVIQISGMGGFGTKSYYNTGTYTPGVLTNNTWYYLYRSAAGFTHNTTAPDQAMVTQAADPTRRYVGCFRSSGAGAILRFTAQYGLYLYQEQQVIDADLVAAAWATLSLAARVPPTARLALVQMQLQANMADQTFKLRPKGSNSTNGWSWLVTSPGLLFIAERLFGTSAAQEIEYGVSAGNPGTDNLGIWVTGWRER